jgi:hypothetical protein
VLPDVAEAGPGLLGRAAEFVLRDAEAPGPILDVGLALGIRALTPNYS